MSVCTPKSFDLTGKVALITGASYGIGFAIATAMANCGATIVFNDIKQELVDKGLAAYKEAGITAHGYVCDVTNEDAVNAMVKQITEEVGHINILVNNAGIIKRCDAIDVTPENWDAVDFLKIEKTIPFHRAFDDTYYTAEVMKKMDLDAVSWYESVDYHRPPQTREEEIFRDFKTYQKFVSKTFATKEEAMSREYAIKHMKRKEKLQLIENRAEIFNI